MTIELEKIDRYSFPSGILDFALKSDEKRLFAACMDGIYELSFPDSESNESAPDEKSKDGKSTAKTKPHRIGRHASYVSSIALIESSNVLVSTAYDGTFQIRELPIATTAPSSETTASDTDLNPESFEIAPRVSERIHNFWSWDMALSPDKRFVASVTGQYMAGAEDYTPLASAEPTVKIMDAETGKVLHALEMLPSVQCVAFDPSSRYLAAGNLMGDLAVWDVESGRQLAQWRTESFTSWGIIKSHCYIGGVFAVSFSPDGESLYAAGMGDMKDPMAGNGKQLWQRFDWRIAPVEMKQETVPSQSGEGLMETLAWHPNGNHFVMAGRLRGGKWNLGVFDTKTGQLIGEAKTGMRITTARYSSDGRVLYLGGMQGQPGPKESRFPDFGYLERYRVTEKV
jgi:WD40 repeat protein